MGLTQKLGTIPLAVFTDSSNNVGIGGAASGSYKFQVTGTTNLTGALSGTSATFSGGIFTDGSQGLSVRAYTGGSGFGAIYSTGVTAGAGNFALAASSTQTILSGVDSVNLAINSAIKLSIASTGAATFSSGVTAAGLNSIIAKSGSGVESTNLIALRATGTGAIGDALNIRFLNTDGIHIANIAGILGGDNIAYGSLAFSIRNYNTDAMYEAMRINNRGNVGIGTSSPGRKLQINVTPISGEDDGINVYNGTTNFLFTRTASEYTYRGVAPLSGMIYCENNITLLSDGGNITFNNSGSERMRITSGGNVLIGSTSAISTRQELRIGGNAAGSRISLGLSGTNYSALVTDSGGNVYLSNEYNDGAIKLLMINYNNGVYLSQSATSWTANSDERLKDINGTIENAVNKLKTLRPVNFSWKSDESKKEVLGLIAQDVEKVFPQVIDKNKLVNQKTDVKDETEYLGVRYVELVPVLIAAIQEQQAQIEELKAIVATI